MVNVSKAWRQSLANDQRDYKEYVKITLSDNTVLDLTNEDIWGGGLSLDDSVSSDSDFQIGAAIINKCQLTINNIYGQYDEYDFYGARVEIKIGLLLNGEVEKIKKGKYVVNNATYNGQLISLECYDYMYFFDVSYSSSNQIFPATIDDIVRNCCTDVGVTLNTYNFPHKTYSISTAPDKTKTTYREIISWCAQICGCFARCNSDGQLELKWYPQTTLESAMDGLDGGVFDDHTPSYSTGDTANGGSFNPWNTVSTKDGGTFSWPQDIHVISSLYSHQISVDDVVITRVQAIVKAEDTQNSSQSEKAIAVGTAGYTVSITGNQFITESNANEILTWLGTQLIGFTFRKATISHASDPSIEAGDCAIVFDRKQNAYPIVVSSTRFSTSGSQNTVSAAQNPLRNSAARFSAETKNYVDLRQRIKNERTTRQQIEAQLADDIANSNGMYKTETTEGGATKYYLHNKPLLSDSAIRILFSDVGITVTANGLDNNPTWYGLRVNGDLISRILTATGVNADWIDTGALVVRDNNNNLVFKADVDNHTVYVKGYATFTDLAGNGTTTINGANITTGTVSASHLDLSGVATISGLANGTTTIDGGCIKTGTIDANRLNISGFLTATDVGDSGSTTISGSRITTGSINANLIKAGVLQSQDSVNYPNFSINLTDGTIAIKKGSINLGNGNFVANNDGSVTLKNATITGYLKPSDIGDNGTTTISGNRITTGTIAAARLDLSGVLTAYDVGSNGSTTISGNRITTGTISASRLDLSGCLTAYDVGSYGSTTISGSRITTGSINASLITSGTLTANLITTGSMSAARITTGTLQDSSGRNKINLSAGEISFTYGTMNFNSGTFKITSTGHLTCTGATLNGTLQTTSDGHNAYMNGDSFYVQSGSTKLGRMYSWYPSSSFVQSCTVETWSTTNAQLIMQVGTINSNHIEIDSSQILLDGDVTVAGSFSASIKNRVVDTKNYSSRALYCYETATPYFGDIGDGVINEDGDCYIAIDPVFSETIQLNNYQVFLQKYGDGDCYVSKRTPSYFIVHGTPNLEFGWEIKSLQSQADIKRLDEYNIRPKRPVNDDVYEKNAEYMINNQNEPDYGEEAQTHLKDLYNERITV